MDSSMKRFATIKVFCDSPADLKLFHKLADLSNLLNQIPSENISVYPQLKSALKQEQHKNIIPLFKFDRPDYIVTLSEKPILVVEVTEHAYTGDNGLQRFTRVASAAENGVAFIYFGPIARTRDDELDRAQNISTLSKRNLTSDFFEGMLALHERFDTPQFFSEWIVAENGKVIKVPPNATSSEFEKVYNHLVSLITSIVQQAIDFQTNKTNYATTNFLDNGTTKLIEPETNETNYTTNLLGNSQKQLIELAENKNTKFSDVRFQFSKQRAIQLTRDPKGILSNLDTYFFKGKPDKLLALFALQKSTIKYLHLKDKVISNQKEINRLLDEICTSNIFNNGAIGYYSGYKWRSDPHCGVAINLYYRKCFVDNTELPLLLFYPRISISEVTTDNLLKEINSSDTLLDLFKSRYPTDFQTKYDKTTNSESLYHHWVNTTKQARIFQNYCSLIFCNDGIILGDKVMKVLS